MHLREALSAFKNGAGSILPRLMLYTIGRTVWELWIDDVPPENENEEAPSSLSILVRSLINDCCVGGMLFKSVAEVKEYYFDRLLAAM